MIEFLIVVYVIPATVTYFGIRRKYKTEWTNISPDSIDLLMVVTPLLNIGYAIYATVELIIYTVEKAEAKIASPLDRTMGGFIDKFFGIKK